MKKITLLAITAIFLCMGINGSAIAQEVFKAGVSGGRGESEFTDDAIPPNSKVIEVRIRSGGIIDAIQIIHETSGGDRLPMPMHGGGGGRLRVFTLDSNEYITGISGRYGGKVDSIRIHTNKQTSPQYGGAGGGSEYHYEAPEGVEVVGFYGRSGKKIDAIGVTMRKR